MEVRQRYVDLFIKIEYNNHILSQQFPMGHKHTHLLAAAFSFLAVAHLMMVMDLQKEVEALNEASFTAMVNNSMVRPVKVTDRGARRTERVQAGFPEGTVFIRGQAVTPTEQNTAARAAARTR